MKYKILCLVQSGAIGFLYHEMNESTKFLKKVNASFGDLAEKRQLEEMKKIFTK